MNRVGETRWIKADLNRFFLNLNRNGNHFYRFLIVPNRSPKHRAHWMSGLVGLVGKPPVESGPRRPPCLREVSFVRRLGGRPYQPRCQPMLANVCMQE